MSQLHPLEFGRKRKPEELTAAWGAFQSTFLSIKTINHNIRPGVNGVWVTLKMHTSGLPWWISG